MVLANTEELHERIERQGARIHELEAALRTLYEKEDDGPHPLLRSELLDIKYTGGSASVASTSNNATASTSSGGQMDSPTESAPEVEDHVEEETFIEAFGTMSVFYLFIRR